MIVKTKLMRESATLPTYATEGSACLDLYADMGGIIDYAVEHGSAKREDFDGVAIDDYIITLHPGQSFKFFTGIAVQPPSGYVGLVFPRSGLSFKGARLTNCVGVVDEDYSGEVIVALHNDLNDDIIIHHGDRIAQIMWLPYPKVELQVVDELDDTERGGGGFGSTGA